MCFTNCRPDSLSNLCQVRCAGISPDFVHDDQHLLLLIIHGERGAKARPQGRMALFHCFFNVVREMIVSSNNNQILQDDR